MSDFLRTVLKMPNDSYLAVVDHTIVAETPDRTVAIERATTSGPTDIPYRCYGDEELVWSARG